ncbi:ATP synthase mitochondrial F1 complex assembly factor 2 isoform X3 [Oryctolagus cuniculus]|uniref:ATP synthase mitochondrial F1 complex assembly factor 2 isoform X3 n=1 Tax=Oryctolagus cuniculus TaxID=9986 RepID=UPI003879A653
MWRSCLRLRDRGRRLLTRPVGPGPALGSPARAYAPPTERKRFYQNVSISQGEGGFEINLDHRKLKTPQAKFFTVPSEALAIAVATEWESQQDTIKSYTMHLTTLCNTSLDNPTQRSKDQLIRAAIKFLDTDTICYKVEEPETLVELQKNEWDPVIEWAENRDRVRGDPAQVHGADLGPDRPAPDGGAGRAAVAPGGGVPDPEVGQRGVGPRLRAAGAAGPHGRRHPLHPPLLPELHGQPQTPAGVRPGVRGRGGRTEAARPQPPPPIPACTSSPSHPRTAANSGCRGLASGDGGVGPRDQARDFPSTLTLLK